MSTEVDKCEVGDSDPGNENVVLVPSHSYSPVTRLLVVTDGVGHGNRTVTDLDFWLDLIQQLVRYLYLVGTFSYYYRMEDLDTTGYTLGDRCAR